MSVRITEKIIISLTDLDHILDIGILEENKNLPPSDLFLEGLKNELELNGLGDNWLDTVSSIEIKL